MRGIASFKRSTAPLNGMDAQRSVGAPLSSPEAAQWCAEGAGLDSGDPGRSTIGHAVDRAPLQHHPQQTISTNAAAPQPSQIQSRISTSLTDVTDIQETQRSPWRFGESSANIGILPIV
jgi:hypothetical protein